jgi:hypothetical protein
VATLLSLDVSGAFDQAIPERLHHNLRMKGVPQSLAGWALSFMTDRQTTLCFEKRESALLLVHQGVPQGSPVSLILFLFYNAELLEVCNRPLEQASALGFADDVNILAYGRSTEQNCTLLEILHERCLDWARRHGAVFAPDKYELMHLTRKRRRFNLQAPINLGSLTKDPVQEVRVLGL